jgi:hypothetical protein
MALPLLRYALWALGLAAVAIGLSIFLLGSEPTARAFVNVLRVVMPVAEDVRGLAEADADSELRFYAVFWIAYGIILIGTARNLLATLWRVPWLAGLFFAGGVGRVLSYLAIGAPHPLFVTLMVVELVSPAAVIGLWVLARPKAV